MAEKRRSAAEIIAFHFSCDIADIRDSEYQHGRYVLPIYLVDGDYYCCPAAGRKPPEDTGIRGVPFAWIAAGEHYGRTVYVSKA